MSTTIQVRKDVEESIEARWKKLQKEKEKYIPLDEV